MIEMHQMRGFGFRPRIAGGPAANFLTRQTAVVPSTVNLPGVSENPGGFARDENIVVISGANLDQILGFRCATDLPFFRR